MGKNSNISRRSFLKSASSSAAGLTIIGSGMNSVFSAQQSRSAWKNGLQINPDISNNKVVCCYNPKYFIDKDKATVANSFQKQNAVIDTVVVENDMDGLAIALSDKDTPLLAWATIFRKPAAKQWNQVKVAIKVNCIYPQIMPRIAIVGKVCKELIRLGTVSTNITIYDACHNAYQTGADVKYDSYIGKGLPDGVKVLNQSSNSGSTTNVTTESGQLKCANIVLESDILINCSVNKGHTQTNKGGYTLSMKNHTGSLKLSCPSLQEMIDENKSDAILGGDPPRQQLCIVDSLWAAVKGPFDPPSHFPTTLVMGTFGPAVDILTARKIREEIMGATHNNSAISEILRAFDISETDLQWVEVPPYIPTPVNHKPAKENNSFTVQFNNGSSDLSHIKFDVPSNTVSKIEITDFNGRVIRTLTNPSGSERIAWNGRSESGTHVKSGTYLVRIHGNGFSHSQKISFYK